MGQNDNDGNDEPPRETLPDVDAEHPRTTLDDVATTGGTEPEGASNPGEDAATDDRDDADDASPHRGVTPAKVVKPFVYILVGGIFFIALAGPILFYFFVWRYTPVAPRHIPSGTNLALRMDAKALYLFDPFRKNVLGVLDDQPGVKSRAARIKKLTGIDPRSDLRELVVASPDGERFVVLLGGYFAESRMRRASVTKGLLEFLNEEGVPGFVMKDDVLVGPTGLEIAQAEDTTVIIASDDDMLKASLQPTDDWMNLGLVSSGALSFVVDEPAFAHAAKSLSTFGDVAVLQHTKRATGFLKLGGSPELDCELVVQGVDSEAYAKEIQAALANVELLTALFPDLFGEKAALASAQVKPRTASVMVTAPWPTAGLEAGTKRIGEAAELLLEKK